MSARNLAERFGLRRVGREWRGRCPACGYAAFVLTERDGRALWWCASCQDGDAITAAVRDTDHAVSPPRESVEPARPTPTPQQRREWAGRLWADARPAAGTLVETYLRARGISGPIPDALRFLPDCKHASGVRLPAMVAAIVDAEGALTAVHRTYLRRDGTGKAAVEPAKATLGPISGSVIRLHPATTELVIAEGIETALSASILFGLPAWSAIAAGNLSRIALPTGVRAVVIAADPDPPGQREAELAAERWKAEGRHVRIATPDDPEKDFNDLLRERAEVPHA